MQARRLAPLALGVVALLALAGIASHGRPLAGSHGSGPTATFFDYVFTTIVLIAIAVFLAFLYSVAVAKPPQGRPQRGRWHLLSTMLTIAVAGAIAILLVHSRFEQRLRQLEQRLRAGQQQAQASSRAHAQPSHPRGARLRWDEVAIAMALLAGTAALAIGARQTRRPLRPFRAGTREALSVALDESLDDLRNEPDLRRAIVAAYARMERSLAAAGRARRPSEAPFEYLERALGDLHASAAAVARLTTLFEWAKFSHHEPEPRMRDEAIDALVAVRDELRRPAEVVVA